MAFISNFNIYLFIYKERESGGKGQGQGERISSKFITGMEPNTGLDLMTLMT